MHRIIFDYQHSHGVIRSSWLKRGTARGVLHKQAASRRAAHDNTRDSRPTRGAGLPPDEQGGWRGQESKRVAARIGWNRYRATPGEELKPVELPRTNALTIAVRWSADRVR
jgi:hypothetical protein